MVTGWEIGALLVAIILFFLYLIYKFFSDEDDFDGFAWSLGSYSKTCEEIQEHDSFRYVCTALDRSIYVFPFAFGNNSSSYRPV